MLSGGMRRAKRASFRSRSIAMKISAAGLKSDSRTVQPRRVEERVGMLQLCREYLAAALSTTLTQQL